MPRVIVTVLWELAGPAEIQETGVILEDGKNILYLKSFCLGQQGRSGDLSHHTCFSANLPVLHK